MPNDSHEIAAPTIMDSPSCLTVSNLDCAFVTCPRALAFHADAVCLNDNCVGFICTS